MRTMIILYENPFSKRQTATFTMIAIYFSNKLSESFDNFGDWWVKGSWETTQNKGT